MGDYPAYPGPYATEQDLAAYWRPLTQAEQSRATSLLGAAADAINELPGASGFVSTARHWVSLDMVKRAMIGGDGDSTKSLSQSMAGMSATQQFVNPTGALYLTAKERNRLRGRFGQAAGSVVLGSHARVPEQPWNFQPSFQAPRVDWVFVYPVGIALQVGQERSLMFMAATWWEYEERTDYAQWSTSDAAVAVVSNEGVVTAIGPGTATITGAYEGMSASSTVTVS